jgi:hypothetical protein
MSRATKKGYRSIPARNPDGSITTMPVRKGGKLEAIHEHRVSKQRKQAAGGFNEYKRRLKEIKKRIPPEERATINWSKIPEKYL